MIISHEMHAQHPEPKMYSHVTINENWPQQSSDALISIKKVTLSLEDVESDIDFCPTLTV